MDLKDNYLLVGMSNRLLHLYDLRNIKFDNNYNEEKIEIEPL